ncbi:hypothetical protein SteCoe_37587 [Stentor coeruleus]|uniref:Uncharacterized protein n=1 Tax=Stentor coeruleus TaxID=5963 RepID=A0A1R2AN34_9CILI|nr:hypothetical protein SteCoe_37587 [Stentor coeruleus]
MFDDRVYIYQDNYDTAKEKRKIKKSLYNMAKLDFSNSNLYKLKYYQCVNEALHNPTIEGKNLDKTIVQCKLKLQKLERFISDTNQHAHIKVQRCVNSKREWARKLGRDLATEEEGVWDCLNRYHRRYLYYYPSFKESKFSI